MGSHIRKCPFCDGKGIGIVHSFIAGPAHQKCLDKTIPILARRGIITPEMFEALKKELDA